MHVKGQYWNFSRRVRILSSTLLNMIDHVNIVVEDIERAARFYGDVLGLSRGFEKTLEGAWIDKVTGVSGARALCVFMEAPRGKNGEVKTRIELLQFLSPQGAAFELNRRAQHARHPTYCF